MQYQSCLNRLQHEGDCSDVYYIVLGVDMIKEKKKSFLRTIIYYTSILS